MVAGDQETDGQTSVGECGYDHAGDPDGGELADERALGGEDQRSSVEAGFAGSHLRPDEDGPEERGYGYATRCGEWRGEAGNEESGGHDVPPPVMAF